MLISSISFSALGVDMNIVVFGMVGAIIQIVLNNSFAPSLVYDIYSLNLTFFEESDRGSNGHFLGSVPVLSSSTGAS